MGRCTWRRGEFGWWYPSCRRDVRAHRPPSTMEGYCYCQFCGREANIDRLHYATPNVALSAARSKRRLCPACALRFIEDGESFCRECSAYMSGAVLSKSAKRRIERQRGIAAGEEVVA